jgi:FtsP/CotA-like multicopper oxidase with cupredoxin domain
MRATRKLIVPGLVVAALALLAAPLPLALPTSGSGADAPRVAAASNQGTSSAASGQPQRVKADSPSRLTTPRVARATQSRARAASPNDTVTVAAVVTIELCAKAGSATMANGVSVPIWGFAVKPPAVACTNAAVQPQLPGPQLQATAGDNVTVTLHNALSQAVSIVFPGQTIAPDTTGAPPGGSKSYSFAATNPGTYLYEAGTNPARQVPMGLYGALIIGSGTPGQAYGSPASAFDDQAVLVLSEIDPALNANPTAFNLVNYAPKYWLINGKSYPQTAAITTGVAAADRRVLLRYLNAGLQNHTMALLGFHQRVIAKDAFLQNYPFDAVAETIASGQTTDTIATVPTGTSGKFALYNRQLQITNNGVFPGGMLTFINVPAGP